MLEDLARAGVRASFYFTLGPDRSGLAVLRLFRRGFLAKMLRTNAPRTYGMATMFYGTLLRSPMIGARCEAAIRSVRDAGHEVALHAWDHVTWQDRLERLTPERIAHEINQGVAEFERILGAPPRAFAAPAWFCTDAAFTVLDRRGFDYMSVTRGRRGPLRPFAGGRALSTIEVPTTLPTLDEMLGCEGVDSENFVDRLVGQYRPGATEVLTVHAETEGLAFRRQFRELLERHRSLGVESVTVAEVAAAGRSGGPPVVPVRLGEIPGRASPVVLAE